MTPLDLARIETLWVYLAADPLLWLTVTLLAYVLADRVSAAFGRHPLANPVLIAVALIAAILTSTGTRFEAYSRARNSSISCSDRPRSLWPCRCTGIGRWCERPRCRSSLPCSPGR